MKTSLACLVLAFYGSAGGNNVAAAFGVPKKDTKPLSLTTSSDTSSLSRRAAWQQGIATAAATAFVGGSALLLPNEAALAADASVAACPPRSNNCIVTTWTAPAGTKNVAGQVLDILKSYPQEGQADVDKGGWTIVDSSSNGSAIKLEYKSGIGNFAKFFNGGKPFVDDLVVAVNGNSIAIRSASRVGDSDMGVNQKRLSYLGGKARALGWDVPEPKY